MKFTITSPAFGEGEGIPQRHSGDGENLSPALAWSGAPEGTKEFALISDDPDAKTPEPWVHWVLYNIPATVSSVDEGGNAGATEGKRGSGKPGYGGPMPPPGHGVHHYHFRLYALDAPLGLQEGATKDELLAAMKGHVLAEALLIGTYERK